MSRRVSDEVMKAYEEAALEGLKALKAYNAYQGTSPDFLRKAKVNLTVIGAYPKLYGAETNRMAVELAMEQHQPALSGRVAKRLKA